MVPHVYSRECAFKSIEDIKGKKVTIMGLGLNGGGEAAVRFFVNKGAQVTITDMKTEQQLAATIERLENDEKLDMSLVTWRLGEHRIEDFANADCVIKNPGVKYEGNRFLAAAKAIESDLSIFLRFTDCPIIAVTGSKGKSSTVSAIYYGLKEAGYKAFLGGNITVSPLTFFDQVNADTPVVIEFSSWQLADLRGRGVLRPHISLITKIVPDHQNWYGNMEDYVADKRLIYADQTKGDYAIFDDEGDEAGTEPDSKMHPNCSSWGDLFSSEAKATVLRYGRGELTSAQKGNKAYGVWQEEGTDGSVIGKVLLPNMNKPEVIMRGLSVPGEHMKTNVLNAALVMYLMGVPAERCAKICSQWQGIDHRLQYFHSYLSSNKCEYRFYNDSCATVPEAAAAASQAFGKAVYFITGGTDKGLELNPLSRILTKPDLQKGEKPVKDLYLLAGSATDKLIPALDEAKMKYQGPFNSLEALLKELKTKLDEKNGQDKPDQNNFEVVVFSPGATSFGMFNNEFDRGNKFMTAVKSIF